LGRFEFELIIPGYNMKRLCLFALLLPALLTNLLQSASPTFTKILPRGGKPGTTIDVKIYGTRISDIREVLFYSKGLVVKDFGQPEKAGNQEVIPAKLTIAPDCEMGEHKLRVVTNSGITYLNTFWVGPYETVFEVEPNSDFAEPQVIPMNRTVEGLIGNEDVDYYAVAVKKGERLSVEVEAMRLGDTMFDPYVAILNSQRFELAAADDTPLLLQDSFASIVAPEDGTYRIEIRDSSYGGNGSSHYRLHVGNFPRPQLLFPSGAQAGTETSFKFLGDAVGLPDLKTKLPSTPNERYPIYAKANGQVAPSPNFLRVSPFRNEMEPPEPNEDRNAIPVVEAAPLAFNGVIQEEGDVDWLAFQGKKGQNLTFIAHARSVRSPLDPVLNLYQKNDKSLKSLKGSDDIGRNPDSKIDFRLPADDVYFLRITDHLQKGGPNYIYRIEITDSQPEIVTKLPPFGNNDNQARQMIPIPKGNCYSTVVLLTKSGIKHDLQLLANSLPQGVIMHAPVIAGNLDRAPVVFEAAADAPLNSSLIDLRAKTVIPQGEEGTPVEGGYGHEFTLIRGPGNSDMYTTSADRLAAAVTEEAPFIVEILKPLTPIIQRGTLNLIVKVTKKEGFDENIVLRMLWLPPGIGSRGTVTIPKGKDSVDFPLTANADAALGTWKIALIAEANTPQGQILVGSKHQEIIIEEPFLNMGIELAAIERGQSGQVLCTVETLREFKGEAEVRLVALPAHTSAEPRKINKDAKEVLFPVETKTEAQARTTKNIFVTAIIPYGEHTVIQTAASGGQFRIDNPPPAPKTPAPKPAEAPKPVAEVAAKPAEAPAKPLSRLEKLRLLAKQQREGN
jgi:hypothetical protein